MIVYKATNTVNGKVYIGKTVRYLSHAKARHHQRAKFVWKYGCLGHFYNAIRKHGFEAFAWEIVYRGTSDADIQAKERELIADLSACDPSVGYNMTPGGDGGAGKKLADAHKVKMSAAFSGEGNWCFGKFGPDHPAFGHTKDDATRKRISDAHTGKPKSAEHRANLSKARLAMSRYTDADRAEMVRLREQGLTYQAIGVLFDASHAVIWKIIQRANQ
jgi:group I intron endonuclease